MWDFAYKFASGQDVSRYGIDSVISNNRLHFIAYINVSSLPGVMRNRGYIRNGDRIFDNTILYSGRQVNFRELYKRIGHALADDAFVAIGHAQHRGEITIVEFLAREESIDNLKIIVEPSILPGM